MEATLEDKKLWRNQKHRVHVMISFYKRTGTITVWKDVIRLLGAPSYLSLRVNKFLDSLMIVASEEYGPLSFMVPEDIYSNGQCVMRFSSKPFLDNVYLMNGLDPNKNYQIDGTYIEERNVVVFNMKDAKETEWPSVGNA